MSPPKRKKSKNCSSAYQATLVSLFGLLITAFPVTSFAFSSLVAKDVEIPIAPKAIDWDMQESTGRVFCLQEGNLVTELSSLGKKVRQFKVEGDGGGNAVEIQIKSSYLVVVLNFPTELVIYDLKSNKKQGSIDVERYIKSDRRWANNGSYFFHSEVDNDFIYYTRNSISNERSFYQINLADMLICNKFPKEKPQHYNSGGFRLSRDGKSLLVLQRFSLDLYRFDEEECKAEKISSHKDTELATHYGNVLGDRWVTRGSHLRTYYVNDNKLGRIGKGEVCSYYHPLLDIGVRLNKDKKLVEFVGVSDGIELQKTILPTGKHPLSTRVYFDLRKTKLFLATDKTATWVDMSLATRRRRTKKGNWPSTVKKETEMTLKSAVAKLEKNYEVSYGTSLQIPLKLKNDNIRVQIQAGPTGAGIENDEIVWKPTFTQMGTTEFVLRISDRNDTTGAFDERKFSVVSQIPSLALPFYPLDIISNEAQSFAVVWGIDPSLKYEGRRGSSKPDQIATIDLANRKIINKRSFTPGIKSVVCYGEKVIILPRAGNSFYVADKKLENPQKKTVSNSPYSLAIRDLNKLAVVGKDKVHEFALPELNKNWEVPAFRWKRNYIEEIPAYVYDRNLGTFPNASHVIRFIEDLSKGGQMKWAMNIRGERLHDYYTGHDYEVPRGFKLILSKYPIVACFAHSKQDFIRKSVECHASFCSLIDGKSELTMPLFKLPLPERFKSAVQKYKTVFDAGDQILYLLDDRIAFIKLPREVTKAFKAPPTVKPVAPIIASVGQKITKQIETKNFKENISFELDKPVVGAQVDSKTGTISVDSKLLWKNYVDSFIVQKVKDKLLVHNSKRKSSLEGIVESYLQKGRNIPTGMIPLQDSFIVKLVNENGRTVHKTRVDVVLVGPRQDFVDMIARKLASPEADKGFGLKKKAVKRK